MWLGRRGRWRNVATVVILVTLATGWAAAGPAEAATPAGTTPLTPIDGLPASVLASLPPLPKVPAADTDGQNAQTLLDNAITLVAVGVDSTAVQAAMASVQAKAEKDAVAAGRLEAKAVAADRVAAKAASGASSAAASYQSLDLAVRNAVLFLYTKGPQVLTLNPAAGEDLAFAEDYAESAITPNGILAAQAGFAAEEHQDLATARKAERAARKASAKAAKDLAAARSEESRLTGELASISKTSASEVEADHAALTSQASKELLSSTGLQFTPKKPLPAPLATTVVALDWAFSELGKTYVWGGTGPTVFDCSGLTQYVWRQAGVSIPRVAAAQYAWTVPVPLSQLLPGDLVFYGTTDIHHVGIYIGDGLMINAPHTGTVVQVSSIWWSDLAGFGRVHMAGTPVSVRTLPSAQTPTQPVVVASAGPVPSQTKPPAGWKAKPGSTTPILVTPNGTTSRSSTTTSTTVAPSTTTTTTDPGATTTTTTTPGSSTTTSTTETALNL
jgi:cell wall-associated NlpC family hydrolase